MAVDPLGFGVQVSLLAAAEDDRRAMLGEDLGNRRRSRGWPP